MTESEKIITAARHYCLDLFHDGLSTQQAIARGLLNGVEFLVGKEYLSTEFLKSKLILLASQSLLIEMSNYSKPGHIKKFNQENENFSNYINNLSLSTLDNLMPLPFKRRLLEEESIIVRQNFRLKWNFDCWGDKNRYWEPLVTTCPYPFCFYDLDVIDKEDFSKINSYITALSKDFIFKVTEDGLDYEIDATEIGQRELELAFTDKQYNWIIYISDEGTIAFSGEQLLPKVEEILSYKSDFKNKFR